MEYWFLGILLTLVGTTLSAIGLMIQKYAHALQAKQEAMASEAALGSGGIASEAGGGREPEPEPGERGSLRLRQVSMRAGAGRRPHYFLSWWWLLGISVFLSGHIVCYVALGFGAQVVLSCLNVWTMVVTFLVAPVLLGETVNSQKALSVAVIIFGVSLVTAFGPREEVEFSVERLVGSLRSESFVEFTALALACGFVLYVRVLYVVDSQRSAFEYAAGAAMLGWYSVLCAKCSSGLLLATLRNAVAGPPHPLTTAARFAEILTGPVEEAWRSVVPWLFLASMVVLALSNVHLMNMALRVGEGVLVVPVYESLSILGQVVLGVIFFGELRSLDNSSMNTLLFWLGVSSVLLGIFLLTKELDPSPRKEDEVRKGHGQAEIVDEAAVGAPLSAAAQHAVPGYGCSK
jgi:uncharacterized membrane protein